MQRVCEVFLGKFNPWAILATKSNTEIDLVSHRPESVDRYVTKGSQQRSLQVAIQEVEHCGSTQDMMAAAGMEEEVRPGLHEFSMAEAFYLLDPRLNLTTMHPTKVIFVSFNTRADGQLVDNQKRHFYNLWQASPAPENGMSLGQMLLWFREERRGGEEQVAWRRPQENPIKVITPDDVPLSLASSNLPQVPD